MLAPPSMNLWNALYKVMISHTLLQTKRFQLTEEEIWADSIRFDDLMSLSPRGMYTYKTVEWIIKTQLC